MKKSALFSLMMVTGLIITAGVPAGSLEPSWGPQSGSGLYTLSDVYYYLTEGTEGSVKDSFQGPTAGPGSTMMNTKVIYDDVKSEFDGCVAGPGDVLSGTTFFSTDTSAWGVQSGTIATQTLSPANDTVDAGFYAQTTLSTVDSDLATGNIKDSVTIFGVLGTYSGGGVAGLPKTGQFVSYTDYDDGWYANPAGDDIGNPQGLGTWSGYTADGGRFTIQTSGLPGGVVLDNATGLSWATGTDGAGCNFGETTDWSSAVAWGANLEFAGHTDWRLPNVQELYTIVDLSVANPAVDPQFFPNTHSAYYYSSTTYINMLSNVWMVSFDTGAVNNLGKYSADRNVRAVRGGE